jgi:mRNA interferase RelE/StbE
VNYTVILSTRAVRERSRLPSDIRERVTAALLALEGNPRPPGCLKMAGSREWRIRVGRYRVRYLIDDASQRVLVTRMGHRRDVYER